MINIVYKHSLSAINHNQSPMNFSKPILFLCLFFAAVTTFAQQTDSLAYQLQRKKVNTLLSLRTQKFNQYFESLDLHTGIFGLQTKKDIRRSNDILMDIVKTDNAVFKELKVLLDYRSTVQTQVQDQSRESENRNTSFIGTINKLRNQTEKLKTEIAESESHIESLKQLLIGVTVLILILLFSIIKIKSTKAG